MAKAEKKTAIAETVIPDILTSVKRVSLVLHGLPGSPLVVHAFAEKVKQEIRDKQQKKVKEKKQERDPNEEFLAARYVDAQGRECAPLTGIKKAMVSAATAFEDLTKVGLRQAIFVSFTDDPGASLVPIELFDGSPAVAVMREDAVTIGNNIRGLTYRPCYNEWQLRVDVEFNSRIVSEAQVLALMDQAGWGVGICEGRPEKTSALGWGRFLRVR